MKAFSTLLIAVALTATGNAAATGSFSLNQFNSSVMPVLVQVNASGKVTHISSSMELRPSLRRLLRKNIQEQISKPAMRRQTAVASQLIMNMTLKTQPRDDGKYDAQFVYVSAQPLPAGAMHWVKIDGHRLALARDNDLFQQRPRHFRPPPQGHNHPSHFNRPSAAPSRAQPTRNAAPPSNPGSPGR